MPVFNTATYLSEALQSVLVQTYRDFELVVIDDGSTDESTKILNTFALRDARIRLIARGNRGLIATRNELLGAARGELLAWMDSDDVSLPGRFARQVEAFDLDPELMCVGSAAQCIDPEGENLNIERWPLEYHEIMADQQRGGGMRFPTTMMRTNAALRVGAFREPFRIGEDLDFLLRLSEFGKLVNLADVLYLYRQRIASVCATLGSDWILYRDQILALAHERARDGQDRLQKGGVVAIDKSSPTDRKIAEWRVYINWAGYALSNSNFRLAWKYARAAIALRATSLTTWKLVVRVMARWGRGCYFR